jgi:2-aminoadipate transaminase
MIRVLTSVKQGADMCSSGLSQLITLQAMQSGLLEKILPQIISIYRSRRDALCAAMSEHLSDWFDWEVPVGGMFVWAVARDATLDTDLLAETALKSGVCVSPSSVFDPEGTYRRALRINFTLNPPDKLAEGIRRLSVATQLLSSFAERIEKASR